MITRKKSLNFETALYWAIIILCLCWGSWLRIADLGDASYWIDEAFSIESAQSLLRDDVTETPASAQIARGPVYHFLLSGMFHFFGETEFTSRILSALCGVLLILTCTLLGKRWFGMPAAAVTCLLMSSNYWQIAWSRQAREYMMLSLMVWLSLSLIDWARKQRWHWRWQITLTTILTVLTSGIHLFGAILFPATIGRWVFAKMDNNSGKGKLVIGALCTLAILGALFLARLHFVTTSTQFHTYGPFLWQAYWPVIVLSGLFLIGSFRNRKYLIGWWIAGIALLGFGMLTVALPLTNMRYSLFLVPVFFLLSGGLFSQIRHTGLITMGLCVGLLLIIMLTNDKLQWKPARHYLLESQAVSSKFTFYTPQPDFRSAYHYLNNRLPEATLVTPYPAMSRRYRSIDDSMALDIGIRYHLSEPDNLSNVPRETYTGIPYASVNALIQLTKHFGDIYILIDTMGMQRVDKLTRHVMLERGELLRKWRKPPYSDLFLYRFSAESFP